MHSGARGRKTRARQSPQQNVKQLRISHENFAGDTLSHVVKCFSRRDASFEANNGKLLSNPEGLHHGERKARVVPMRQSDLWCLYVT